MRKGFWLPVAALSTLLAACSGGGSGGAGIGGTPTPTPAPNTALNDLHANQLFDTDAASGTATYDTSRGTVTSGGAGSSSIQVSYDATARSYTVSTAGRSETFTPSQIQTGTLPGETRYAALDGSTRDYLTLVVTPYTSGTPNRYVAKGYWQRNALAGTTQSTTYDAFVYGFATPAAAVPRTGTAGYAIDVFGLVNTPGKDPRAFTGAGTFQVDLLQGLFQTKTYVTEASLTNGTVISGGQVFLQAAGHVSSGNGLSGNVSYNNLDGVLGGTIAGRFYGPGAEEVGASFSADNGGGASVTGSLTGQRDPGQAPVTQSLTNLVADVELPEHFAEYSVGYDTSLSPAFEGAIGYNQPTDGKVTLHSDGSVVIQPLYASTMQANLTAADRSAAQRTNFVSYDKVVEGRQVHLDLYKPGGSNTELALTYASFGIWREDFQNGTFSHVRKEFMAYGLETPSWLLSRRTGSGTYDGVVYGATTTLDGTQQDVGGTSRFDVDFNAQHYSGSLDLNARAAGGATSSLGTWTFGDRLVAGQMAATPLFHNGVTGDNDLQYNSIRPRFYGPDGEEIAATFTIQNGQAAAVGVTGITGVTVAKRR